MENQIANLGNVEMTVNGRNVKVILENTKTVYIQYEDDKSCTWIFKAELTKEEEGIEVAEPTRTLFRKDEKVYVNGKSAWVKHENGELITVKFRATGEVETFDYTEIVGFIPNYEEPTETETVNTVTTNNETINETIETMENQEIVKTKMTVLEKNQEIFQTLKELKETGRVIIKMSNTTSTGYGIGSLEGALKRQVVTESVHTLDFQDDCDETGETEEPTLRVKLEIIALDNYDTMKRKIEMVREHLQAILDAEAKRELEKTLNSENLFEFLDSNFRYEGIN